MGCLTGWDCGVGNICHIGSTAGDVRDHMMILAQPAMAGNLEQICPLSWIRHQDATQKVTSMRRDIFGKGQWRGCDVFVEEIDVVTLGVGWIIVERQVACQHGILAHRQLHPLHPGPTLDLPG